MRGKYAVLVFRPGDEESDNEHLVNGKAVKRTTFRIYDKNDEIDFSVYSKLPMDVIRADAEKEGRSVELEIEGE